MTASTPRIDRIESTRNLAINGNFDLWQRGTSFSAANNAYTADRFHWKRNTTTATQNITQDTDVPTVAQSGFQSKFSWLMTQTSTVDSSVATDQLLTFRHYLEGFDYATIHMGNARIQFWMKASIAGNYAIALVNGANNRSYVTSITVNSANTWELKTIDVALDTTGTWALDNTVGLFVHVGMMVGTTFKTAANTWTAGEFYAPTGVTLVNTAATNGATVRISQYMIVPGSFSSTNSLSFSRVGRNIADEIDFCQRYYEKTYDLTTAPATNPNELGCLLTIAQSATNGFNRVTSQFKTRKRTVPVITLYNPNTGTSGGVFDRTSGGNLTGGGTTDASEYSATLSYTTGSVTIGDSLEWHFTADAEV